MNSFENAEKRGKPEPSGLVATRGFIFLPAPLSAPANEGREGDGPSVRASSSLAPPRVQFGRLRLGGKWEGWRSGMLSRPHAEGRTAEWHVVGSKGSGYAGSPAEEQEQETFGNR